MTDLMIDRGDDRILEVAVTMEDGVTPQSLAGAELAFTAKRHRSDADADAVITKAIGGGITVTDAPGGLAEVSFDAADTEDLDAPLMLLWDLQGIDALDKVITLAKGRLLIQADITRAGVGS